MLAAGRLTATMKSKKSGSHITLTAHCMAKQAKWNHVAYADATHVFLKMGLGEYGSSKIGTYYPKTGKLYFDTDDKAWQYATVHTLLAASSGVQDTDKFEVSEEERCGKCGLPLTDPVSIARGLGPTCAQAATGSHHYNKADREETPAETLQRQVEREQVRRDLTRVVTRPQDVAALAQVVNETTDKKGRNVPKTFAELAARVA